MSEILVKVTLSGESLTARTKLLNYSHWCPCWIWMTAFISPSIRRHTAQSCDWVVHFSSSEFYLTERRGSVMLKKICISNMPSHSREDIKSSSAHSHVCLRVDSQSCLGLMLKVNALLAALLMWCVYYWLVLIFGVLILELFPKEDVNKYFTSVKIHPNCTSNW